MSILFFLFLLHSPFFSSLVYGASRHGIFKLDLLFRLGLDTLFHCLFYGEIDPLMHNLCCHVSSVQ